MMMYVQYVINNLFHGQLAKIINLFVVLQHSNQFIHNLYGYVEIVNCRQLNQSKYVQFVVVK